MGARRLSLAEVGGLVIDGVAQAPLRATHESADKADGRSGVRKKSVSLELRRGGAQAKQHPPADAPA